MLLRCLLLAVYVSSWFKPEPKKFFRWSTSSSTPFFETVDRQKTTFPLSLFFPGLSWVRSILFFTTIVFSFGFVFSKGLALASTMCKTQSAFSMAFFLLAISTADRLQDEIIVFRIDSGFSFLGLCARKLHSW